MKLVTTFVRRLVTVSSSFSDLGLLPALVNRVEDFGIRVPTEIQCKSLPPLLEGKSAVINAETGSGKTLCYLLPFVQQLCQPSPHARTRPFGLFIVPSQELSYQVVSVFDNLVSGKGFRLASVCSPGRLVLQNGTVGIIGTTSSLTNYHWPVILKDIQYIVVDEADLVLSGASNDTAWKILNYLNPKQQRKNDNLIHSMFPPHKQFVFSGATIPAGGKMAVQSVINRWFKQAGLLQNTAFLSSSHAHGPVPSVDFVFPRVTENSKTSDLLIWLDKIRQSESLDCLCRILVFTNTLAACGLLYSDLTERATSNQSLWWSKKLARFDKSISAEDRVRILEKFKDGRVQVLVCTDLASRGLDVPDVSTVIQYDFPENSTAFLHRSGRTGRAGKQGRVVSFVGEESSELASLVEEACQKGSDLRMFETTFSRNRKLRRRLKRQMQP